MKPEIKTQAAGRWVSICINLGMPDVMFNGKHQPCLCGGVDRFRWNKARESPFCSSCGIKTPMSLVMAWLNLDFKQSAEEVRKVLGISMETKPEYKTDDIAKNQARIDNIRKGLKKLNGEDIASLYLTNRGLNVLTERDLYFHASLPYYGSDGVKVGDFAAMVGLFRNSENNGSTLHVTYLTKEGKKADVESPKKILPLVLPLPGCAIKLFNPVDGFLAIAEGIETSLAVNQFEGIPVWASGNAANMASLILPELKEIAIYADADLAGMSAAFKLAERYRKLKITIRYPSHDGELVEYKPHKTDFLDWMLTEENERKKYKVESLLSEN